MSSVRGIISYAAREAQPTIMSSLAYCLHLLPTTLHGGERAGQQKRGKAGSYRFVLLLTLHRVLLLDRELFACSRFPDLR